MTWLLWAEALSVAEKISAAPLPELLPADDENFQAHIQKIAKPEASH